MNEPLCDVEDHLPVLDVAAIQVFHDRLDGSFSRDDPLSEVRALEELKNAICARQARATVAAHRSQRSRDAERGVDRAATARLVGAQVALARRSSTRLGSRLLGLAHAVVEEMPHTFQALTAGVISERDAVAVVSATACLARADRAVVDAAITDDLGVVSHRRLWGAARAAAYRADPQAFVTRRAKAESDRRVSLRPAPDCMTWLTALLPVKDGVACYAGLRNAADARAAQPRGRAMADALVERVTGRTSTEGVDLHVDLLMPIDSLVGDAPAHVPDYGPIPGDLAREWVTTADATGGAQVQVRRVFSHPGSGDLVGMDSRARSYPGLLAHLIKLRDQTCRTPWCDAPIRHTDHIVSHAQGGATSERNGQGLCARCNYVKEHPDITVTGDATETTVTTAPAPPVPRWSRRTSEVAALVLFTLDRLEERLEVALAETE